MKINQLNWMIGGEAGYGIMNAALTFAKLCSRQGLFTFTSHEYPSLIRGGHNSSSVRIQETNTSSHLNELDILIALNKDTIEKHLNQLTKGSYLIYDQESMPDFRIKNLDINLISIPMHSLSRQISEKRLLLNSIALGAAIALLELNINELNELLEESFKAKGKETINWNLKAAELGYKYIKTNFKGKYNLKISKIKTKEKHYILSGNEAISLGAIAGGCKFLAQYPMTPTSQILSVMAQYAKDCSIVVLQPEDEISSIHMAIGASFAGIRAMTCTSGGGFCLMSEGFGLAGITEIPIVVVNGQRSGPATGLPTKHEQSDLKLVLNSGQGEIARIVISPSDVEDAFYSTIEAFNLAEQFQVPVILLVDKYLCTNSSTIFQPNLENIKLTNTIALETYLKPDFKRYSFNTIDGISPRSIPGQKNGMYNAASDEHDEYGQLIDAPEIRKKIMERRLKKSQLIEKSLPKPELFGPKNACLTVVSWGSTKSCIREAIEKLPVNHLHIKYMMPFQSSEIKQIISKARNLAIVECNYTSQLASLIMEKTGIEIKNKILRYDGKQFTVNEIKSKLSELLR